MVLSTPPFLELVMKIIKHQLQSWVPHSKSSISGDGTLKCRVLSLSPFLEIVTLITRHQLQSWYLAFQWINLQISLEYTILYISYTQPQCYHLQAFTVHYIIIAFYTDIQLSMGPTQLSMGPSHNQPAQRWSLLMIYENCCMANFLSYYDYIHSQVSFYAISLVCVYAFTPVTCKT